MFKRALIVSFLSVLFVACDDNTDVLYNRLRNINELELVQATLSKTYTIRDPYDEDVENGEFDLFNAIEHYFKQGDRVGVYGLRRTYAAYIDLNELSASDITFSNNDVRLKLPPVRIKTLGNDLVPTIYHERVNGLRFKISESERMAMRKNASEELDRQIQSNNNYVITEMTQEAERKATEWFSILLRDWGYTPEVAFKHINEDGEVIDEAD
ncbi:MAG: DUF4230 domain-containing protein [Bacteroidales bacterium]|nr:DUF4230 domain-containing protein [Bacteroidales bacterium]